MTEYSPISFYQENCTHFTEKLKIIKRKLLRIGMLRLVLFLLIAGLVYLLRVQTNVMILAGLGGLVLFLILVSKTTSIRSEKKRLEKLLELNKKELRILNRDLTGIDEGRDFLDDQHFYNQDIDLFGAGSIFQVINRTGTGKGREKLAEFLNANEIEGVKVRQEAIKELSEMAAWRQGFQTTAELIETQIEHKTILQWMLNYRAKIQPIFRWLPTVISIGSILVFVAYGFGLVSGGLILVWFFVGLIITLFYIGHINKLYQSATQMTETFASYSKLFLEIENKNFTSELLVNQQNKIKANEQKASFIFNQLAKDLNSLDQRNNFLFALGGNGFLLWDLNYSFRIERWIEKNAKLATEWFEVIAFFDAYNSLGNYAFNYPNSIYPSLSESENVLISADSIGHPLLKEEARVTNDFKLDQLDFFIITGANMAGKSTFLRTVAINLVLANVGLPVVAKRFEYAPIKLISSMRTSDSLLNDESYFFSELKRLKFIVDQMKVDRYFIILDEILKGTNSKDKEEGSKKFVQKLVSTQSSGIIATHDLSLCELSNELSQIKNYYFDAEIVNDELYFDYRFKKGICQNMNASFLLRKMEIV
jgi:DNA mismatch repair ATPase MutS